MASSIPSKVLGTFNKAPSTFANSSSGLIPGIGKRQKHLFAPASYYYTFDNKDILPGLTKDQDKMIAQLVKDMGNVHKHTTKAPIPGQMADKAFDLIYRTDHFALKQKFLQPDAAAVASNMKMTDSMVLTVHELEAMRAKHNFELTRLQMNYRTGVLGVVGLGLGIGVGVTV